MVAPNGNWLTPVAVLAWRPFSPNNSINNSEAPSSTCGCFVNCKSERMKPCSLTTPTIVSKSIIFFFKMDKINNTVSLAASFASLSVTSAPTAPINSLTRPDTNKSSPTRLQSRYAPTGSFGVFNFSPSLFNLSSMLLNGIVR